MKIHTVFDFIYELENITKFHEDRRWDELINRLRAPVIFVEGGAKKMSSLIDKKHILKTIQDIELLIQKAKKDVRD